MTITKISWTRKVCWILDGHHRWRIRDCVVTACRCKAEVLPNCWILCGTPLVVLFLMHFIEELASILRRCTIHNLLVGIGVASERASRKEQYEEKIHTWDSDSLRFFHDRALSECFCKHWFALAQQRCSRKIAEVFPKHNYLIICIENVILIRVYRCPKSLWPPFVQSYSRRLRRPSSNDREVFSTSHVSLLSDEKKFYSRDIPVWHAHNTFHHRRHFEVWRLLRPSHTKWAALARRSDSAKHHPRRLRNRTNVTNQQLALPHPDISEKKSKRCGQRKRGSIERAAWRLFNERESWNEMAHLDFDISLFSLQGERERRSSDWTETDLHRNTRREKNCWWSSPLSHRFWSKFQRCFSGQLRINNVVQSNGVIRR